MWDPKSCFAGLSAELRDFADRMPERFFYTPENLQIHVAEKLVGQFVFLHVAFHQVRLFLHRSALSSPGPSGTSAGNMPKEFYENVTETSLDAANKIAQILSESQQRGFAAVAPFIGYCAFNASLVHLVRMFSVQKNAQAEAKKYMEICLRFLLQLRQYWGLFCSITDNLKMLYRKFSESSARGKPLMGHQEAARALQYGDWFHKYPKGVSASEYEDSAAKGGARGLSEYTVNSTTADAALSHRSDLQTADEFFARLGPRRGDRDLDASAQTQQAPVALDQNPHSAPRPRQSPPSSTGHVQSPNLPKSATILRTGSYSAATPTIPYNPTYNPIAQPGIVPSQTDVHTKLGSQSLPSPVSQGADVGPIAGTANPYTASLQQQHHSRHGQNTSPPSAAVLQSLPPAPPPPPQQQQVTYTYPPPTPQQQHVSRSAMQETAAVSGYHHQGIVTPPTTQTQPYLYDSYPRGSDTVQGGAWLDSFWAHGFNHPLNAADANAFVDQSSSAWFMPFNSIPPEFDTGGLETFGMLAGLQPSEGILCGGVGGRRAGGGGGGGGGGVGGGADDDGGSGAAAGTRMMSTGAGGQVQVPTNSLPSPHTAYHNGGAGTGTGTGGGGGSSGGVRQQQ